MPVNSFRSPAKFTNVRFLWHNTYKKIIIKREGVSGWVIGLPQHGDTGSLNTARTHTPLSATMD